MPSKILMPSGGQTIDEMEILKWYKAVGDTVQQGDILFEIETDKAILTVESFASGTVLEIRYPEGTKVRTGEIVAYIGKPGESIPQESVSYKSIATTIPEQLQGQNKNNSLTDVMSVSSFSLEKQSRTKSYVASPLARKLAAEGNIDIGDVAKFFSTTVVKKREVKQYADQLRKNVEEDYEVVEVNTMRKAIANHTKVSASVAPHFYISVDVDMEECIRLRNQLNGGLDANSTRISFNDIIMKVVAKAITSYPLINASWFDEKIKMYRHVHFGLAVAVKEGLVITVVRNADKKSIGEIAADNAGNIARARDGQSASKDMGGGTITLSNLGMYGVNSFTAILNQPEACIIALGGIIAKPIAVNRELVVRDIMNITASFDHRVVDGAIGAAFLQRVKETLEKPNLLLL